MHVVVNHLYLREPLADDTVRAVGDAVQQVVGAGGHAARVVRVDERHLILLLEFGSAEDADRVSREIGGPWMREHIVPLLARETERSVGEVIASAQA
ncbi:MAG TPA: hypothetical protein VLD13_00865 [Gaiellaceae bacterium]|nr:hypothetical protein [Gaiellaceae bacterium]